MKTYEVDVELHLRKTLLLQAPDADTAHGLAATLLRQEVELGRSLSSFLKWTDGRRAYRPMPVETIIDNDPQIVAVREAS